MPARVLFVCTHNSGRSQMAEAFANRLGRGKISAESAGTEPAAALNPQVVRVMEEIGYDLSGHYPKLLTSVMVGRADRIIGMGCGSEAGTCPVFFLPAEDWKLEDPQGRALDQVRLIRDQIQSKVEALILALAVV